jgi:hypothetical protein
VRVWALEAHWEGEKTAVNSGDGKRMRLWRVGNRQGRRCLVARQLMMFLTAVVRIKSERERQCQEFAPIGCGSIVTAIVSQSSRIEQLSNFHV